ncbi:MAG: RNA polymerase subunit sigma-24, partial [Acidimicrobiia bacterium]|nr:RNA polymerase subunit sigma-24 [Acidimicrobiia bacterium]
LLDTVESLDDWHFYWSARADFLRRLYRGEEARIAYKRALDCDMNETDRAFLTKRLAEVG